MVRVATWNIGQAAPARHVIAVQAIAGLEAHVVVLTEVTRTNRSGLRAGLAGVGMTEWVDSDPPAGQNGVAVASTLPLVRRSERDPCDPWAGTVAVDVGGLTVVGVYGPGVGSHTGGPLIKRVWWDGMLGLTDTWRYQPSVITGDFNNGENYLDGLNTKFTDADRFVALRDHGFRDGWREHQPAGAQAWSWWRRACNSLRLDHIFVSEQVTVHSAEYVSRAGGVRLAPDPDDPTPDKAFSEHAALVAELEFPHPEPGQG